MEDIEMAPTVERKLSHKERAEQKYGPEKMAEWRRNKSHRNYRKQMRKEHANEIKMLEAIDSGLHGRIRHLENRNQMLLKEGQRRMETGKEKLAAKKKVVVAPSGTKRLLDGDCGASGSKRYREQSQSELATTSLAEYEKAKTNLDTLCNTWETKLAKCTSPELPGLSEHAVAIKAALMLLTRKSADRILHAKGTMLGEEEKALRKLVADYEKSYAMVKIDLEYILTRKVLPTDVNSWLSEIELQLQALQLPLASRELDDVVLKLKELGIAAAAKSDTFAEDDLVLCMEAEKLTERYNVIKKTIPDEEEKFHDVSKNLREIDCLCNELELFVEEQYKVQETVSDPEKAFDVMAINMGMNREKISSLPNNLRKMESLDFLKDKEEKIKRIKDVLEQWELLETFVETEKKKLEKEKLEGQKLEIGKSSKALGTFLDSVNLLKISHLPTTSLEMQRLISKLMSSKDMLVSSEKLLDDLKFAVRALSDPCDDADELFARWRMCVDSINQNHDLYVFWRDVCVVIERQSLHIEQKSECFPLLNSGKKDICSALSKFLIQEFEGYLRELDVYENQMRNWEMEDVVRDVTSKFFQGHREKLATKLSMVKSALSRRERNEVGEATRREENDTIEESTEETAARLFDPVLFGTSPSVRIPFTPGTSARRRAIGPGGGVFPDFEVQKVISGEQEVYLSCITNPAKFTIQLVSKMDELESMQDALNKMKLKTVVAKIGRECVAPFLADGRMYRAKVTEITTKAVKVEFVDYGNIQLCKEEDLRELPQRFRDQPYCYRCCLAGIRASRAWTDDDISKFSSIDQSTVHLATFLKTVDGISQIRLNRGVVNLNVKFGMPEFRNVSPVSTGFKAKLWPTTTQHCTLASLINVDDLYFRPSNIGEYKTLFEDLNAFYGSLEECELSFHVFECQIGDPCVVLDEKNEYHRAVLQSNLDTSGQLHVLLIDKGLRMCVKQHFLRQIVPEFLALPPMLWKCKIFGVKPLWAAEGQVGLLLSVVSSAIMEKGEIAVTCHETDTATGVHAISFNMSPMEPVASHLIAKYLAEAVTQIHR